MAAERDETKVAMMGGGRYSLVTKGAKDVIDAATPLVLQAIEAMPPDATGPFTMADIAAADGGTSLQMVRRALTAARARYPGRPLQMIYTDQPRNDFNSLFRIVHGLTEFPSYLEALPDVHVLASATSFYRQMLPAGTLSLGFSATAMHWLSRKPADIADHVQAVGATGAALAAFAAQGRRDWETILLMRAAELAPHGRLVLVNFCRDEQGRYLGHTGDVDMFGMFNTLWREFLARGAISEDEYRRMTLPQYYRTVEEFTAPLLDPESQVHRAGLRLENCETRVVPCPFAAEFAVHGDAERFARDYVPTLRSWTESTFLGALDDRRPAGERQAIVDRYYATYEARVRQQPKGHAMDYVHAYMTIAKSGG